jgi:glycosyltransferase involved in cell wall biosynthesis
MTTEARDVSRAAPPEISVIIPVRNGGEALERCLAAVWSQETGPWRFEVLVVDNGSPEDTRRRVSRFPGTILLFETRPSSYAARNLGLAMSRGRVLAFTDADTEPRPGWLHRGAEALAAAGGPWLAAGEVQITLSENPTVFAIYDKLHNMLQERYVREGGYGVTANLFVPRQLAEKAGRFADDWVSGADVDFCRRITAAGARIIHLPDAVVLHPARTTFAQFREKKIRTGRGKARIAGACSAWGRLGHGFPAALAALPLLFWPGAHAFRSRFQGGLQLSPQTALAIQLLHWLGKWFSLYGRLSEACSRRPSAD